MATLPSTQPFRIGIPDQVLDDLRMRLSRTRRTRVLERAGWEGGSDPDYLDALLDYWRDGYDWRRHERELNQLAHFVADIDDARVHYIHETGLSARSVPVLLLHGWPDSFLRYRVAIPLLVGAEDDYADDLTCDVVVPSLPGFAFTGQIGPPGDVPSIKASARLLHRLMTEVLGYEQFIVSGGDGGSAIAQSIAIQFPASVMGIHLTDIGWREHGGTLTDIEQKYVAAANRRFMEDGAYAAVHMSQPRALAASLNDSPAGLASWIVDRFHSWCDSPRHLEQSFSKDEMLTNITIYWATQTIQSSIYGYLAETRRPSLGKDDHVDCPVGLALFPRDLAGILPRRLAERTLNVVRWTEMPDGGHFGAWERPAEFAADLKGFVVALAEPLSQRAHHGFRAGKAV
ncbi:MAG TPA: epoxide hydrolase [Steroidobacteraceae bacterium]|nr:epoxide hydrolase [Steroidobacteraceae bacterium]